MFHEEKKEYVEEEMEPGGRGPSGGSKTFKSVLKPMLLL